MKKTVYISGPISGMPDGNVEAFMAAEAMLTKKGWCVINPHTLYHPENSSWCDFMRRDIAALLIANEVYALQGWRDSRGARLEVQIAKELDMPVTEQHGGEI